MTTKVSSNSRFSVCSTVAASSAKARARASMVPDLICSRAPRLGVAWRTGKATVRHASIGP
jgi:hypothetical protein